MISGENKRTDLNIIPRGKDTETIAFIMCENNQNYADECKRYISLLDVPEGMEISVLEVTDAKSMTAGYNEAMNASDAKYKVYLHQDVFILNTKFIFDILKCFESDDSLGMIGVAGAKKVPQNAYVCTALDVGGCNSVGVFSGYGSIAVKPEINNPKELYEEVEYIDGMLIVTSYDIPWDEKITGFHFYDLSQCVRYRDNGLKIAVAKQQDIWTFHDFGPLDMETYDMNRKKFCEIYKGYVYGADDDNKNIYSLCKKVYGQLREHYDNGEYDVVEAVLKDLQEAVYFHQDLLTMTFAIEINKLKNVQKGNDDMSFDEYKVRNQSLRFLLIRIENLLDEMSSLADHICEDEYSLEEVMVMVLHNTLDPQKFLDALKKELDLIGGCKSDFFNEKLAAVKEYEKLNLILP